MSLKAKLKPYIFAFGLIFSLFFYSNVSAVDNPSWAWQNDGTSTTGADYQQYYDENENLILDVSFSDTITLNFGFTPTNLLFYAGQSLEYSKIKVYGSNYYLMGAICDQSHLVNTNFYFGSYNNWCQIERNEDNIKLKNIFLKNSYGQTVLTNYNGLTKTDIDNYFSTTDVLENNGIVYFVTGNFTDSSYQYYGMSEVGDVYDYPNFAQAFPLGSSTIPDVDGACGTADNVLPVTVPIPNNDACSSGTVDNMREIYSFDGIIFAWECLGSGEGITVSCESLPFPDPIDGVCGGADGQSSYNEPDEEDKCLAGSTNATTTITLTGWAWTCNGLYGGTDDACSSTYSGGGTPPEDIEVAPIPTPTDCSSYSGIDEIVCNIGNTIQGLFLPSSSKLIELQNTINDIGNVFPFNYLRAISTVFTNLNFSSGSLTMTMFGNTETLGDDFWNMEIFENIKLGVTILILLMFTFWALGYIKHFFK